MILLYAFLILLCFIVVFTWGRVVEFLRIENVREQSEKYYYQMKKFTECEANNKEHGYDFSLFFKRKGYKRIVIYALGVWGDHLLNELNIHDFEEIIYADGRASEIGEKDGKKVCSAIELLNLNYDVIVVSSLFYYEEIKVMLRKLGITKEIVGYNELVFNAMREE